MLKITDIWPKQTCLLCFLTSNSATVFAFKGNFGHKDRLYDTVVTVSIVYYDLFCRLPSTFHKSLDERFPVAENSKPKDELE